MTLHRGGGRGLRLAAALLVTTAAAAVAPPAAVALPTASFSHAPLAPVVGEEVTFTFTGACDEPPCRVQWRWFRDGGSSVGTSMGEGEQIGYAFPQPGDHRVTVRVVNAGSTHGSASATQVVSVGADPSPPPPPPPPPPPWVQVEDDDRAVALDGWRGVVSPDSSGGGHHRGHGRATLLFTGRRVVYSAVTGPDLGVAEVSVDRARPRRLDLYSPTTARRSWVIVVPRGPHRLTLRSTGRRSDASTGRAVTVDGFVVGDVGAAAHVDDRSPRVTYGHWAGRRSATASGGTVRSASAPGAALSVELTGTGFAWVTATGPDQGRARVVVDGTTLATVDNHAATSAAQRVRRFTGLAEGRHRVTIVALGGPRGSSEVVVDAVEVPGRATGS